MADMTTVRDVGALRALVRPWQADRLVIGFVPTMGALHEGHLSLVARALAECDRVVVSIFVNPIQFNNPDDLALYPRTEDQDLSMLAQAGAHVAFVPDAQAMYPQGFATGVQVRGVSDGLCGAQRPGHFDGVATVVSKLLLQTQADRAYFGEKDFQQLQVVRRVVTDLDIPVEIVGCPTVREPDGLAMSSRNRRLSDGERMVAARLPGAMRDAAARLLDGAPETEAMAALAERLREAGFARVDYASVRRAADLGPYDGVPETARLFVAAWIGQVRLIDNVALMDDAAINA